MNIIRLFTDPPTTQISIIAGRTATLADGFLAAIGFIVAILSALILHEIAHGFVAYKCGDNTAKSLGRLSLNPLKHLDLFGTICMLIVGFGWAKPVPINPYNFRNGRKGMFLVSIAGVTTNILLSFIFIGLLFAEIKIALLMQGVLQSSSFVYLIFYLLNIFFEFGAMLNIFFCLFTANFPVRRVQNFANIL
ncbi:MAG: site-2 protease family protein [Clostridia bacterium]